MLCGASVSHSGRKENGTVAEIRQGAYTLLDIPAFVVGVTPGYSHAVFITDDGRIFFYGSDSYGSYANYSSKNGSVAESTLVDAVYKEHGLRPRIIGAGLYQTFIVFGSEVMTQYGEDITAMFDAPLNDDKLL